MEYVEEHVATFRQSVFGLALGTVGISLIISLVVVFFLNSISLGIVSFFSLIVAMALANYLTYTTTYVNDSGIVSKSKLKSSRVDWQDIFSMATIYSLSGNLTYQIKSKNSTLSLPIFKNWQAFEQYVVDKARLEIEGVNNAVLFTINSPGIKRWKKRGEEYTNTSVTDWIFGMGYVNDRTWKLKSISGIILFIVGALGALLLYLLDEGVL